jgi:hypothetical protein
MKKFILLAFTTLTFLLTTTAFAHEDFSFEYICSVTQKNKDGLFRDVVNVVFMPEWQKKSHIYHDDQKDIWFEIVPVLSGMGEIESYQMELKLYLNQNTKAHLTFHGPEFSEIGFENEELNIGSNCFHHSQRGQK